MLRSIDVETILNDGAVGKADGS